MSDRLYRLVAVVKADVLIRLRRPSTAVVFVLLSIIPYMWIPDPATGRALIQIGGSRALYNSAAIGMATAALGSMFIGLVGFYVISNALKRDVLSRCGFVIASTGLRGSEYIAGKFAGNVAFLSLFTFGYMAVAMAMVLVRGEAPLEPLVFAKQYLLMIPPAIVFVSAISITFECTPLLRSRLGDVAYFILWLMLMGGPAAMVQGGVGEKWASAFDVSGLGFLMQQIKTHYHTDSLSIGMSNFDPAVPPVDFAGLQFGMQWVLPRIVATIWPLALLGVARIFFHRFDPARVKAASGKSRATWLGRLNLLAKPLARLLVAVSRGVTSLPAPAFVRSALTDAIATIAAFPLVSAAIVGFGIAALTAGEAGLFRGVLPFAYAACAIAVADIACREKRSGTSALVFAAPGLRARFVAWKMASTVLVAIALLGLPVARAIALQPQSAFALVAGVFFVTAVATALGIVSANPKTFIVLFLTFWYVVLNDSGHSPELDFAGWYGLATPAVSAAYAAIAVVMLVVAQIVHAAQLRRDW